MKRKKEEEVAKSKALMMGFFGKKKEASPVVGKAVAVASGSGSGSGSRAQSRSESSELCVWFRWDPADAVAQLKSSAFRRIFKLRLDHFMQRGLSRSRQ